MDTPSPVLIINYLLVSDIFFGSEATQGIVGRKLWLKRCVLEWTYN